MSKRPTKAEIQAHYADDIKAASDRYLWAILNNECRPKYIGEALKEPATLELRARGHEFPEFTRFFLFER